MRRAKVVGTGGIAALVLVLAAPGPALGATTFGAALDKPPSASLNDEFTFAHAVVPITDQAAGGLTAPSDGVITRWRVKKGGADAATLAFRVLRGNASVHRGAAIQTPAPAGTYAFETRVPVQAGDRIGLDQLTVPSATIAAGAVGASFHGWYPSLGESEDRAPTATQASLFLLLNADLENDADADGFGDESQDNCPTVANSDQVDADSDGIGDLCDPTPLPPDTDPPEVTITKGAPNNTSKSKITFKFESNEPGSTFECKKDRKPWKPCTSPTKMRHLDEGKHTFKVRATDPAGNTGKRAKDKFKVVG